MRYPNGLVPDSLEIMRLPKGGEVHIPKTRPTFERWTGRFEGDTYGNKPIVDVDGEPMFAELAILRTFRKDGWDGVWVDTFSRKHRISWGDEGVVKLSGDRLGLLKAIHQRAGSASGCFDVYCWKGERVLFAESKHRSKDKIRDTQLHWLEAALQSGLEPDSFLVVEWSFAGASVDTSGAYAQVVTHRQVRPAEKPRTVRVGIADNLVVQSEGSTTPPPSQQGWEIFFDAYDEDAHNKFIRWIERYQNATRVGT